MGVEIEKKFLLKNDSWRADVQRACDMDQGYLAGNEHASVRIRVEQGKARLNIKSATTNVKRK